MNQIRMIRRLTVPVLCVAAASGCHPAQPATTSPDAAAPTPSCERTEQLELDGAPLRVAWFADERFDDATFDRRWAVEGDSIVRAEDGWLVVRKPDPDAENVATVWYRLGLPRDIVVRLRVRTLDAEGPNACNANMIVHAREADGGPLRFGRSGQYALYHKVPNYIMTFTGGVQSGWSRLRRDPGFTLLSERQDVRSEVGRTYEVTLVIQNGRIRAFIDGRKIHDVVDQDPLPGGWLGLRTWNSTIAWTDVQIGRPLAANPESED